MEGRSNGSSYEADVVPFEPAASIPGQADQLDAAGETILQLIHRAAGVAEENSRHAVEIAQKLSHQLRASEDRIAELEAEAATYRERAERAEQWLRRIYSEIDNRFLRQRREDERPRSDLN
jgi:hypothetical protein